MDNVYLEREVEKLKLELAVRADFTHQGAWKQFDMRQRGHLNLHEFIEVTLDFVGLEGFKPESAHLLYLTFAKTHIGAEEFCKMILP